MAVRITKKEILEDGYTYIEASGLSTDDKPDYAGLATGSLFLEVDKGDVYAYDESAAETKWGKVAALGGGS